MPYTEPWKLAIIEHDEASRSVKEFFTKIWAEDIILHNANWSSYPTKKEIIKETPNLGKQKGKILTLYGDGGYHHYTYGLCYKIASKKSKDYMYIHIDNHTDAKKHPDPIDCGSFVEDIADKPKAKDLLLLGTPYGSNEKKRTIVNAETLTSKDAKEELRNALRRKPQKDVYTSFDLDILNGIEITTSYNAGHLSLENLLDVIEVINEEKSIVSADMLGFTNRLVEYCPSIEHTEPVSLLTYAVLAAKITGRDTKEIKKLHDYFRTKRENLEIPGRDETNQLLVKKEFEKLIRDLKI